ncbi:hypothetical protein FUAX_22420 [Fulvitalea axinellae]|uniref:NRDE family protein n=1 Tax=Fulvitalea axinellae TaxID=1182444 RepID=A0AAU9DBP7_9BACT|nr:hypothetical protein FUAX_22420 [Fulvitalea axinellae]
MCTVTLIPINKNDFILTSNRDEQHKRPNALLPNIIEIDGKSVLAPIDSQASGTWILTTENNITACLLNGAFEKHISDPPYARSRGLVVRSVAEFEHIDDFAQIVDLEGVEPFTLVLAQKLKNGTKAKELRWDGSDKHITDLDPNNIHIWSSATLYSSEIRLERENVYKEAFETLTERTPEKILEFHTYGMETETKTPIFLKTSTHQTVSTTQIIAQGDSAKMYYQDWLTGNGKSIELKTA